MIYAILSGFIGFFLGWSKGWVAAHDAIAAECTRLGGFFVKNKTFKCTEITNELQ